MALKPQEQAIDQAAQAAAAPPRALDPAADAHLRHHTEAAAGAPRPAGPAGAPRRPLTSAVKSPFPLTGRILGPEVVSAPQAQMVWTSVPAQPAAWRPLQWRQQWRLRPG